MTQKVTALIDADGLVYATGAVAETVSYAVGDLHFDYKSQANEYVESNGLSKEDIEKVVDAQPVSHALNAARTALDSILEQTKADEYEIYLSNLDKDNFRLHIYPEYKANRKNAHRPKHFHAIRNWFKNQKTAVETRGLEPDDLIAIRAHEIGAMGNKFIIVTNDKDMQQIAGDHYNPRTKKFEFIKPYDALHNLYMQILVGDSIDNIKGCPGIGPAKARTALRGAETEEEMLEAAYAEYVKAYSNDEKAAKAAFELNARLVQLIQRRPE